VSPKNSYAISDSLIDPNQNQNEEPVSVPQLTNSINDLIAEIKINYEIMDYAR
jgi:hypothetical protein